MKVCPFCAEEVQEAAVKCKNCGSWLDGRDSRDPRMDGKSAVATKSSGAALKGIGFGLIAIAVIVGVATQQHAGEVHEASMLAGLAGLVLFVVGRFKDG
jgi:uncharacterized membrane protein YvbJ